jgi:hypothetical protein
MATYDTTGKYALRALLGASGINEIDDGFLNLRNDIRDNMAGWAQGNAAGQPAASAANAGMIYQRTDSGQVLISTGAVWIPITGPVDRQTIDTPAFSELTLTTAFQTLNSFTFTPPFNNLEYQVWYDCGLFLNIGTTAGTLEAYFQFQLDGVVIASPALNDPSAFTVGVTGPINQSYNIPFHHHFPILIPSGSHTLRVQAKKSALASGTVLARSHRRLTALALGWGTG